MNLIEALRDYRKDYDTFTIRLTTGLIDSNIYGEGIHEIATIMCRNPEEVEKCIEYLRPYWDKPLRLERPEIWKYEDTAGGRRFTVNEFNADIVLDDGDDIIRIMSTDGVDIKGQEDMFPTLKYTGTTIMKYDEQEELKKVRKHHEECVAFRKAHEEEEAREREERERLRKAWEETLKAAQENEMTEEERRGEEEEATERAEEVRRKAEEIRKKETEEEKKRMQEIAKKNKKKALKEYREKTEEELIAEDDEFDFDEWFK